MGDFSDKVGEVLLGAGGNLIDSIGSAILGNELGKANSDKLWNERYSPQAQVRNLAAAGINPAVAMGNNSPVLSSGGEINPVPVSPFGIGTTGMAELGTALKSLADAKKAGTDTRLAEEDIKLKQIEVDLQKTFAKPNAIANLMSAYKNLRAQDDEHNLKEWQTSKEKFLSQLSGIQKDTAQKVLDNMDYQINQENKKREEDIKLTQEQQKTEGTKQTANRAAANASNTQAAVNRELARYQRVVADVEESASPFKLENLLRHYAAQNMISDADYQEAYRRYERLKFINADNDKHEWNKALDAFMFYLEEHVKGLSPFVSAASTNYSTK